MNFLLIFTAITLSPAGVTHIETKFHDMDRPCMEIAKRMTGETMIDRNLGIRLITKARCISTEDRYPPNPNNDPFDLLFGRPPGVYK